MKNMYVIHKTKQKTILMNNKLMRVNNIMNFKTNFALNLFI